MRSNYRFTPERLCHYRKNNVFRILIIVLCLNVTACTNNKTGSQNDSVATNNSDTTSAAGGGQRAHNTAYKLKDLYIENTSATSELATLLSSSSDHKLVFKFQKLADGSLTLMVWPGKQNNKDFDDAKKLELHQTTTMALDVSSEKIILGDQDIVCGQNSVIRGLLGNQNAKYIIFSPVRDNGAVVYSISISTTPNKAPQLLEIARLNPSPPKNAL